LSLLLVPWVLVPNINLLWQAFLLFIGLFHDLGLLRNRGLRSVEIYYILGLTGLLLRLFLLGLGVSTSCACVIFPRKFSNLYSKVQEWVLSDPRIPLLHLKLAPPDHRLSHTQHYLLLQ
jgi:hypothetical protein